MNGENKKSNFSNSNCFSNDSSHLPPSLRSTYLQNNLMNQNNYFIYQPQSEVSQSSNSVHRFNSTPIISQSNKFPEKMNIPPTYVASYNNPPDDLVDANAAARNTNSSATDSLRQNCFNNSMVYPEIGSMPIYFPPNQCHDPRSSMSTPFMVVPHLIPIVPNPPQQGNSENNRFNYNQQYYIPSYPVEMNGQLYMQFAPGDFYNNLNMETSYSTNSKAAEESEKILKNGPENGLGEINQESDCISTNGSIPECQEAQTSPSAHDETVDSDGNSSDEVQVDDVMMQGIEKLSLFQNVIKVPVSNKEGSGLISEPIDNSTGSGGSSRFKKTRIKERTAVWNFKGISVKDNYMTILPCSNTNNKIPDMEQITKLMENILEEKYENFSSENEKTISSSTTERVAGPCEHLIKYQPNQSPGVKYPAMVAATLSPISGSSTSPNTPTSTAAFLPAGAAAFPSRHRSSVQMPDIFNKIICISTSLPQSQQQSSQATMLSQSPLQQSSSQLPQIIPSYLSTNTAYNLSNKSKKVSNSFGKLPKRKRRWSALSPESMKYVSKKYYELNGSFPVANSNSSTGEIGCEELNGDLSNRFSDSPVRIAQMTAAYVDEAATISALNSDTYLSLLNSLERRIDQQMNKMKKSLMAQIDTNIKDICIRIQQLHVSNDDLASELNVQKNMVVDLKQKIRSNLPQEEWVKYGLDDKK